MMENGKMYVDIAKINLDLIDEKRLSDPKLWFRKASSYSSTVFYLEENITNGWSR